MRFARLAALLLALALPATAMAETAPDFRWDGIWAGIGASANSTEFSLPGPQPFFALSGLSGGQSTTASGASLDLSVSRLWQRRTLVWGVEASASKGGTDFTDPWPGMIVADPALFSTICTDCARLLVNGTVTTTARLRGLIGTTRPDGTLWFASLGVAKGSASLSALGSFESQTSPTPATSGILGFAQTETALTGITFGLGISRPVSRRAAIRFEVTQDRLIGDTPGYLAPSLGPDIRIRTTRLALSYQLRF